jgi:hypothetical protein
MTAGLKMTRERTIQVAVLAPSLAGYIWIGYFTVRTDFTQLILLYLALFGLYFFILYAKVLDSHFKIAIGAALAFRLALLFMTPNLTDDHFRFIWDGLLVASRHNPYLMLPSEFIHGLETVPGLTMSLYSHLNSPDFYSVYPPVCQFIFGLSAKLSGGSIFDNIILLRVFILLAEFGTLTLLYKLARLLRYPPSVVFIYAFNPLVVVELTGNLHLEAIMVFFLLLAIYLLVRGRRIWSAVSLAMAIATKLVPIIFLPLLIKRLGWRRIFGYFALVGGTILLLFSPFLTVPAVTNFLSSVSLFFRVLIFNGSIYYVIRRIGYQTANYSLIAISGYVLLGVSLSVIATIAIRERDIGYKSLFSSMQFCLTVFLFLAPDVHPWYLATLLVLSVFTRYKYALVWSSMIVLTYAAYQTVPYSENLWLVAIEYLTVVGWLAYEALPRLAPWRRHQNLSRE